MKKILSAVLLILGTVLFLQPARAQSWEWARASKQCPGIYDLIEAYPTTTDPHGNVYVAGQFPGSCAIFGADTVTNSFPGTQDISFITKYDSAGNAKWTRSPNATSFGDCEGIASDDSGNIYVTGIFYGSSITFGTLTLLSPSSQTNYLVKYDSSGNVVWGKTCGGRVISTNVTTAHDGSVYLWGGFYSPTMSVGPYTLTNASANTDLFIARYDAAGNVIWAKRAGGINYELSYNLSCDRAGHIYVTGLFQSSTLVFGSSTLTNADTTRNNIFIAKYDSSGSAIWGKEIAVAQSTSVAYALTIKADNEGNVYLTSAFQSDSIVLGSNHFYNDSVGGTDIFVVKYDSSGNVLWAKHGGGRGMDYGFNFAIDISGNVWLTCGSTSDSVTLDTARFAIPQNFGTVADGSFIVEFDPGGTIKYITTLSGGGDDYLGIAADMFGNIYLGGDYLGGPVHIGPDTLTALGTENFFVAKLGNYIDLATLGITPTSKNHEVTIYPNPANNGFTVVNDIPADKTSNLCIINTLGQTLKTIPVIGEATNVNTSDLPGGFYICRITINGTVTVKKIVINH